MPEFGLQGTGGPRPLLRDVGQAHSDAIAVRSALSVTEQPGAHSATPSPVFKVGSH